MKIILTFLAVTLLNGAFLYPLFMGGIGRPIHWWLVALMVIIGTGCIFLLVRYRRQL